MSIPIVMESAPGPETIINGQRYLYFGGTSYYGLHNHPKLIETGIATWKTLGTNTATSRRGAGTAPVHLEVEAAAARFFETEDCAYLASGYLSNTAGVQALYQAGKFDVIFIDEHAHFCVHDAARSTAANMHTFSHLNPEDLQQQLKVHVKAGQKPMVLSDGIFPALGKIVPLAEYLEILEPWNGLVWLDDAHAAGVLGANGRGTAEYFGVNSDRVFTGATLAKAFGGFGGIVKGASDFIRLVRSGPVMSAASAPPSPVAAATAKGIQLVSENPQWRERLWENARQLKKGLREMGLNINQSDVPIATFPLEGPDRIQQVREQLLKRNIFVQHTSYPGAGPGGMLRIVVFSSHSDEQINHLLKALSAVI